MNFNPDTTKQVQERGFPVARQNKFHPPLVLSNVNVTQTSSKNTCE